MPDHTPHHKGIPADYKGSCPLSWLSLTRASTLPRIDHCSSYKRQLQAVEKQNGTGLEILYGLSHRYTASVVRKVSVWSPQG